MQPSVLVVTVTYNSSEALRRFLASVADASSAELPVIVAENASAEAEETRAVADEFGADFRLLSRNVGYGGGVEAVLRQNTRKFDYLLISNPDVELKPGSVDELLAAAEETPDAGSLGPRILDADGTIYPSARDLPSLRVGAAHAVLGRLWPSNRWTRAYRTVHTGDERQDAGWLSGACLLVRKTAYEEVGGFDTGYFMYFEDVDLGARLGRSGWRNIYVPDAVVIHTGAHSTSKNLRETTEMHHRSAYRYLSRKYAGWYLAPLRLILRVGLKLRLWTVVR